MTLKHRLTRLEKENSPVYHCTEDIPTPVLEAMVCRAYREAIQTPEEDALYRKLKEGGFDLGEPQ
ncbi:hypothetical protein [Hyphomonas sp.]|uniref:hypothetical protein n=1 Tax=Hyphomonas sp. TaxID=87 RepID=UPI000C524616|nr:hypothetical protein [Hyphomonas sp.]MAB11783.1 hypothetical protein [Hyphomonas sp.]MAU65526.1 hypothetical protein [Hyphomonas sp.]MBM59356.1 hypothetical protein [Hyphomonas sp.]|tara:strand:+ start:376 stop:570 length:195 start_codon:yes stop_codon:yes gene_type:complete